MAIKLLNNITAYEGTTAEWAASNTIYPANSLLFVTTGADAGKVKKGNGVNKFSALTFIITGV